MNQNNEAQHFLHSNLIRQINMGCLWVLHINNTFFFGFIFFRRRRRRSAAAAHFLLFFRWNPIFVYVFHRVHYWFRRWIWPTGPVVRINRIPSIGDGSSRLQATSAYEERGEKLKRPAPNNRVLHSPKSFTKPEKCNPNTTTSNGKPNRLNFDSLTLAIGQFLEAKLDDYFYHIWIYEFLIRIFSSCGFSFSSSSLFLLLPLLPLLFVNLQIQ